MTRLTKNLIYNVAGQGLVLVLTLVAVRFIFRRLGDDVFGIIFFNLVLTGLLASALELGVSSTIVREVSRFFQSEPGYVRDLIRTASVLYWAAGLLLVVIIWLTAPLLVTQWVNLRTIDSSTAATTLRLLSGTALVVLPKGLYTSLFRGRQLMGFNNAIDVGTTLVQQSGILLLILGGSRVYLVAAWISASALLGLIAYAATAASLIGWRALVPSFSPHILRRNIGFTAPMMVASFASIIHVQAAQVIVSKLLPIAEFGFYGFASSTVNRAGFVTGAAAQAAFPSFSGLFAAGDLTGLRQQYRKLQDLVCYGTLPLFAGICFAALPVYTYVFSANVADRLLLPTAFLALGSWMNATINIPYVLSIAMGKPQIVARLNLYALIAVLPITVVLVFRFGIPGAGFSWVVYHLFAYAYMVPRICRECLKSGVWSWYAQVLRVLALAAGTYGLAWLALSALSSHSLPALVLGFAVASAAFGAGAYFMIGSDLRETVQRLRRTLFLPKAIESSRF